MSSDIVHVVMGGGIVLATYRADLAHLAYQHARCITGTTVETLVLDMIAPELRACIEVLDRLPPEISSDLAMDDSNTEWDGLDDVTPEIATETYIRVDDIDDDDG